MHDIDLIHIIIEEEKKKKLIEESHENRIQLEIPDYSDVYRERESRKNKDKEEVRRVIIIDI